MKVMFQGKEIELESATDDQMSLDYITKADPIIDENANLGDTIEITDDMLNQINAGEENE